MRLYVGIRLMGGDSDWTEIAFDTIVIAHADLNVIVAAESCAWIELLSFE